MSTRTLLILGTFIAVCIVVLALSFIAADQLAAASYFRGRPPFIPFGRGPFDRLGPFGRHWAGWRGIVSAVGSYGFLYLSGVLTLFAVPRQLRGVRDAFGRGAGEAFRLFGIGSLGGLAVLLLIALGMFTFVAFPLPLLLLGVLLLAAWGGLVGLALALGRGITRRAGLAQSSPVFDLALGTLLVFALGRIPLAGWLIVTLLGALGVGAVLATHFGTDGAWSLANFNPGEEIVHE